MAIVSISRVQHRRGLQQDLPQLASAELGWSLDEQRLYIGNGNLGEGAPRLGNTEILTEHSDILRLAQTYTFRNEAAGYTPTTGGRTNKFNSIAYNNGLYIAVGIDGTLLTSTDTATWSPVYPGTKNTLNCIAYGNGYFVAVGASGTVVYSTDGSVWNKAAFSVNYTFTCVVYAGSPINNFIATTNASNGTIVKFNTAQLSTVPDNGIFISQAVKTNLYAGSLNSVDYDLSSALLVAVGDGGGIITSTNGSTWTLQDTPTSYRLNSVKFATDQWIAAGDYSTVLISLDGISWGYGYTDSFRAAANNNTYFIFVGDDGIAYSVDGTANDNSNLVILNTGTTNTLNDILYTSYNTLFVAVGINGTIVTSGNNGATWTTRTSGTTEDLQKVFYDGTLFIAVGTTGKILTSSDTITWTSRTSGTTENLYGVSKFNTSYIAVGTNGKILTSSNGTTWATGTSGISEDLESIAVADLGGGSYVGVIVGTAGSILRSTNGTSWTICSSGVTDDFHGVQYITYTANSIAKSYFFAVGNNGAIVYSTDGTTWSIQDQLQAFGLTSHLFNVYYGIGSFWIVGSVGYTSVYGSDLTESETMTQQSLSILYSNTTAFSGPALHGITYGNSKYVIVGQFDTTLTSTDGQNFTSQTGRSFTSERLNTATIYDVIYIDSKFIAVGNLGLILQSTNGIYWTGVSYSFGNTITIRTLQQKLDDFVSVKDFGAVGDGITDDTESINRALYEVYCRSNSTTARKVLWFPAGRYIISDGINVPSNAIIRGEGASNTIIVQTADPTYVSYVFITADSLQQIGGQVGYNGASLPSDITISDIGAESQSDGIWLTNASKVQITRVNFIGALTRPTGIGNETTGLYINGSYMNQPTDINVLDCYFSGFNYAVYQQDTEYSRNILFNSTTFFNNYQGIVVTTGGGMVNTMTVSNCVFDSIGDTAIKTNYATNITSTFNSFRDVGNNYLGIGNAIAYCVDFGTASIGCASINDQFDRTETESYTTYEWVNGNSQTIMMSSGHELRIGLWEQAGGEKYTLLVNKTNEPTGYTAKLSDNSFNKKIQYAIRRDSATRTGIIHIIYNSSGTYFMDDESKEIADVGVIFSLSSNGTLLSLNYTSTATAAVTFEFVMAESYLDFVW